MGVGVIISESVDESMAEWETDLDWPENDITHEYFNLQWLKNSCTGINR